MAYLDSRFHGNDGKWSIETVKQPFLRKQESIPVAPGRGITLAQRLTHDIEV